MEVSKKDYMCAHEFRLQKRFSYAAMAPVLDQLCKSAYHTWCDKGKHSIETQDSLHAIYVLADAMLDFHHQLDELNVSEECLRYRRFRQGIGGVGSDKLQLQEAYQQCVKFVQPHACQLVFLACLFRKDPAAEKTDWREYLKLNASPA